MRQIDALRALPRFDAAPQRIACDTVLFAELVVAREVGWAEGRTLVVHQGEATIVRLFIGRLTPAGLLQRMALEAEEIVRHG